MDFNTTPNICITIVMITPFLKSNFTLNLTLNFPLINVIPVTFSKRLPRIWMIFNREFLKCT